MIDISIIILTFNSEKFIVSCLDSIFRQEINPYEVIIVDNGSKDKTVSLIKNVYPNVFLIENNQNLGACIARNQGIKIAKGKWIVTLDCDIILEKDFISKVVQLLEILPSKIGAVQSKILNSNRKTVYSLGIFLSGFFRFYDIGKNNPASPLFAKVKHIFGVCCAAGIYNRKMLEDIKDDFGYFDQRFFFLVEDVDLALRARQKGWKALYYPQAVCYHAGNSSATNQKLRQYLCWRNRKILLKKCKCSYWRLILISLVYEIPRFLFLFLTNFYVRGAIFNKKQVFLNPLRKIPGL